MRSPEVVEIVRSAMEEYPCAHKRATMNNKSDRPGPEEEEESG